MSKLKRNKKRKCQTQLKERQKSFSNTILTESILARPYPSQENNDDIDGFSSSASDNVDYMEESSSKKHGSWIHYTKNETKEWQYSEIDECDKIAWSNSSHGDEISSEESQVDEFADASFTRHNAKKCMNVSIKEYQSDEENSDEKHQMNPSKINRLEEISQDTIEELSPSPDVAKGRSLLLTDKTEISFKGAEADMSLNKEYESDEEDSAKRRKKVRGGLAERLQKIIAHEKSNMVFWKHTKNKMNEDRTFVVQVMAMRCAYSTWSLRCTLLEDITLYIILPKGYMEKKIKHGSNLRVYPPWKRMFCRDLNSLVILCAYHIEVLGEESPCISTIVAQDLIGFHRKHILKLIGDENEISLSEDTMLSNLETTHMLRSAIENKHYSIVEAVEKNGYGKYMSFCGCIQRVLCRIVDSVTEDQACFSEKIILSQETGVKEERYGLLVQDNEGSFCEVTIPRSLIQKESKWKMIVTEGEGKLCTFKHFRLVKRRAHNRCSSLLSMVQSLQSYPEVPEDDERADSIEDASTQSLDRTVTTSSYLFAVDENTSLIDVEDVPTEFNVCYIPCSKFVSSMNASPNGRYIVYLKLLTVTSSGEESCYPSLFENQCLIYGSCVRKDCTHVHMIKKLSSCFVPINITEKIEEKVDEIVICFKDLYIYNGQFIADPYTRIYLLQENSNPKDMFTMNYNSSLLSEIPEPRIPSLNASVKEGDLIIAQGVICGVDEETALFWNVCSECKSDDLLENDDKNIWCEACSKETSSELNMQLDIFLFLSSMPATCILCKLRESTISKLLPKPTESNFEGYDMKKILNKKFGPSLCQVVDVVAESKKDKENKIFLKEVDHFGGFRKA